MTEFTSRQNGPGLTHRLQAHGIAAAPRAELRRLPSTTRSSPIAATSRWAPHGYARRTVVDAIPYTLSAAHNGFSWAGPTYGEHAMEILEDLLGYDADRIAELAVAEALE